MIYPSPVPFLEGTGRGIEGRWAVILSKEGRFLHSDGNVGETAIGEGPNKGTFSSKREAQRAIDAGQLGLKSTA